MMVPSTTKMSTDANGKFRILRVEHADFRDTFREELRRATNWDERSSATKATQLRHALVQVRDQQNRLLNLRMLEEIDADTFASANGDLRDREAGLKLEIDVADRGDTSKMTNDQIPMTTAGAVIGIWSVVLGPWGFYGVTLAPTTRKPFDLLAKGLL